MIISQVFIAVITPVVILLMLILMNREELVGKHKLTKMKNILVGFILIFSLLMAVFGVIGIFGI